MLNNLKNINDCCISADDEIIIGWPIFQDPNIINIFILFSTGLK